MFSRSCANFLDLDAGADDFARIRPMGRRLPRIITAPGIFADVEDEDDDGSAAEADADAAPAPVERRIVVANQLPLKTSRDSEGGKWCFEWDHDALALQLKDGFAAGVEVVYVGCLKAEVAADEQDEVAAQLYEKFRCVPTFIPSDVYNRYYHGFCKHYLWPLFHYMLPLSPSHGARFNRSHWQAYVSANKIFADKVMEVINPDDDYVWLHDYHLMVLPTFLRKRFHRVKLGFFLHSPFPSSEIYRTLPVRDEILRSLLNADLIGFHTFDYARHFLSCCSRLLGLDYESKRGYIGLDYYGRTVNIKISPVGIHMGQLRSVMSLPETAGKVEELIKTYHDKIVLLGVDDMDMFKGISFKFQAMGQLLEQHPELKGRVVLVQIANPARSRGKDVREVQTEVQAVADHINSDFGSPDYKPIVLIDYPVSTFEKVAYYAISECCVVNAVRDGMNLVPYKYTVCREGDSVINKAMKSGETLPRKSIIIVSEFIGCSPSLSGAIRVNPWNVEAVSEAMYSAISMREQEKEMRHEKHYKYVSYHDVAHWARSFDQDLERACRDHFLQRYWGIGFGLGFRVVALDPNFRKLSVEAIVSAYKRSSSRVILLDYDGTVMPQASVDKTPNAEVISVLKSLCKDPNNIVFIVSGRDRKALGTWFSSCQALGIAAEHGYFTRWYCESEWETHSVTCDFEWKEVVDPVMRHYTEATDGSSIERKESALVWHHQEADPDFGSCQAKELLDHLESVLANAPVVVKRGQHIVEVKPQGVSKGLVVANLISTMVGKGKAPDFVLCVGDDRSDEDMFESLASAVADPSIPSIAEIFACTVGRKPSKAKYYLDDTSDVIKMLQGLANAFVQAPKSTQLQVSFEGSS